MYSSGGLHDNKVPQVPLYVFYYINNNKQQQQQQQEQQQQQQQQQQQINNNNHILKSCRNVLNMCLKGISNLLQMYNYCRVDSFLPYVVYLGLQFSLLKTVLTK